ncbi:MULTISPECIES: hypothetical protein [Pseudomonas]|nr:MULTISPECIES: hypothetical protein [Pseudomonas]
MATIYVLIMLFVALPAACALLGKAAVKYGYVSHPPYSRLTTKTKKLSAEAYCVAAVLMSLTALLVVAGYTLASGEKIPVAAGGPIMSALVASTLALSIITLRATIIYRLSPKVFNVLASSVALLVVLVASIYADAHIAQYLEVKGSELPSALRVLTILLSAYWWTLVFTVISLGLYVIALLLWAGSALSSTDRRLLELSFVMYGSGPAPQANKKRNGKEFIYFTLFVGLAFTSLIPINALASFEKEKRLIRLANELIVFSVFHLKEHDCFADSAEGTVFAFVDADRVSAATPDEKLGYTFELRNCAAEKPQL